MSFDQPRQPAGAPTGGQFATSTRREAGLSLVPDQSEPPVDALAAAVAVAGEHLAALEETREVLTEQLRAAQEAVKNAGTARQAREAGADLAEVEFLRGTVDLQAHLTRFDVQFMNARLQIMGGGADGVIAAAKAMFGGPVAMGRPSREPLLAALDVECDAGRLSTHPWRNPRRDALVADLSRSLEQSPRHPAAPAWREQLEVLADPVRYQRSAAAARCGDTIVDLERTRSAMEAVDEYLTAPRPAQLRVV